jgi:hypothetical protein
MQIARFVASKVNEKCRHRSDGAQDCNSGAMPTPPGDQNPRCVLAGAKGRAIGLSHNSRSKIRWDLVFHDDFKS